MTMIRTGQAPPPWTREQFRERFNGRFHGAASEAERDAIPRMEATTWVPCRDRRPAST